MIKKLALALVAAAVALPVTATDFSIDTAHSYVSFKVPHMVVSKTKGQFNDWSGTIRLAEDMAQSSVEVTINVASIDTANEDRDKHLRSSDFFDAEKQPTMTFVSKRVDKRGDTATTSRSTSRWKQLLKNLKTRHDGFPLK